MIEDLALPMTDNEIIELINDSLGSPEPWKTKEIEIFDEWLPVINRIMWKYKEVGWTVFHIKNVNRHYLEFSK